MRVLRASLIVLEIKLLVGIRISPSYDKRHFFGIGRSSSPPDPRPIHRFIPAGAAWGSQPS